MRDDREATPVFRIDRFEVPGESEAEFLRAVAETNAVFDTMAGCRQRHVLKQQNSPAHAVYLTVVEWESEEAIQKAREAVGAKHAQMKFNPAEMFQRLNIQAQLGTYVSIFEGA